MTNVYSLRAEGVKHAELRRQIAEAFGLDDDDQALKDTLEGESDFNDLCALALREAAARKAMAEGLQTLIDTMQKRKARLMHAHDSIRAVVSEAMLNAHEKKLTLPDMTVSVRMGKPRLVIDETALPDRYKLAVVTMKPNKEAIQADVDNGIVPDGVQIANAQPVLTVRGS
jgi:hypothetical protein